MDPAYSLQKVLIFGVTCKVRVERYDIEADDFAAFPVFCSFDHPYAIPRAYVQDSLKGALYWWSVPGLWECMPSQGTAAHLAG